MEGNFDIAKRQIRYSTNLKGRALRVVSENSYVESQDTGMCEEGEGICRAWRWQAPVL